jgi:uncharacterized protein YdhG (YjbR/CyaY superfamily)
VVTSTAETVDAYLAELTEERATALSRLRELIVKVAPGARETMRYGMPTYEVGPGVLCALASQKQYMSLYVEVEMLDQFRDEMQHLNLGKSCIRFRKLEDLPLDLVQVILSNTADRLDALSADGLEAE